MLRGICLAALAVGASAVAAAAPAQTMREGQWIFVDDPGFATQVYVIETPTTLELRSRGPVDVFLGYEIDVDSDGVVDVGQDVNYTTSGGAPCVQVRTSATTFSGCGGFASRASYSQEIVGDLKVSRWVIPRTELSKDGQSFRFDVSVYNQTQNQAHRGRGLYRFGLGAQPVEAPPGQGGPAQLPGGGSATRPGDTGPFLQAAATFDALARRGGVTLIENGASFRLTSARSAGCRTVLVAGDRSWTIDWWDDVSGIETVGNALAIYRTNDELSLRPGGEDRLAELETLKSNAFAMWIACA